MELWQEILFHAMMQGELRITLSTGDASPAAIVEQKSYQALQQIKSILADDHFDDPECFRRIEAIILAFESIGSSGGVRHDFG